MASGKSSMLPTIWTAFLVVTESWLIQIACRRDAWPYDTSRRCHILALYEHARALCKFDGAFISFMDLFDRIT
jgi:hypothetical protein